MEVNYRMNVEKILKEIKKNAINIEFNTEYCDGFEIGTTKFGGKPDLPKDFEWFYFRGEDFQNETKNRPLSFLAQINCKEVKEYDKDNVLPNSGMIYFFYDCRAMKWGFDPKDEGSAKVYYYDGEISELIRTDFPNDMEEEHKIPEVKIDFSNSFNVPYYEEFSEHYGYDGWDEYDEIKYSLGYEDSEEKSKLLGYADIIQDDMLLECEKVTNGINCGGIPKIKPRKLKKMKSDSKKWQLLFQLSTVYVDGYELMFGDCGSIFFYIKAEDLEKRNFDNCWLILQCG